MPGCISNLNFPTSFTPGQPFDITFSINPSNVDTTYTINNQFVQTTGNLAANFINPIIETFTGPNTTSDLQFTICSTSVSCSDCITFTILLSDNKPKRPVFNPGIITPPFQRVPQGSNATPLSGPSATVTGPGSPVYVWQCAPTINGTYTSVTTPGPLTTYPPSTVTPGSNFYRLCVYNSADQSLSDCTQSTGQVFVTPSDAPCGIRISDLKYIALGTNNVAIPGQALTINYMLQNLGWPGTQTLSTIVTGPGATAPATNTTVGALTQPLNNSITVPTTQTTDPTYTVSFTIDGCTDTRDITVPLFRVKVVSDNNPTLTVGKNDGTPVGIVINPPGSDCTIQWTPSDLVTNPNIVPTTLKTPLTRNATLCLTVTCPNSSPVTDCRNLVVSDLTSDTPKRPVFNTGTITPPFQRIPQGGNATPLTGPSATVTGPGSPVYVWQCAPTINRIYTSVTTPGLLTPYPPSTATPGSNFYRLCVYNSADQSLSDCTQSTGQVFVTPSDAPCGIRISDLKYIALGTNNVAIPGQALTINYTLQNLGWPSDRPLGTSVNGPGTGPNLTALNTSNLPISVNKNITVPSTQTTDPTYTISFTIDGCTSTRDITVPLFRVKVVSDNNPTLTVGKNDGTPVGIVINPPGSDCIIQWTPSDLVTNPNVVPTTLKTPLTRNATLCLTVTCPNSSPVTDCRNLVVSDLTSDTPKRPVFNSGTITPPFQRVPQGGNATPLTGPSATVTGPGSPVYVWQCAPTINGTYTSVTTPGPLTSYPPSTGTPGSNFYRLCVYNAADQSLSDCTQSTGQVFVTPSDAPCGIRISDLKYIALGTNNVAIPGQALTINYMLQNLGWPGTQTLSTIVTGPGATAPATNTTVGALTQPFNNSITVPTTQTTDPTYTVSFTIDGCTGTKDITVPLFRVKVVSDNNPTLTVGKNDGTPVGIVINPPGSDCIIQWTPSDLVTNPNVVPTTLKTPLTRNATLCLTVTCPNSSPVTDCRNLVVSDLPKSPTITWTQLSPTTSPGVRYGGAYWTGADGKLYLFGGKNEQQYFLNDMWSFDPATQSFTQMMNANNILGGANQPNARYDSAFCSNGNTFYLFGGIGLTANGLSCFNDLWQFTGGIWTKLPSSPLSPRVGAAAWCVNNSLYIWGGFDEKSTNPATSYFNDGAVFSNGSWSALTQSNTPSARKNCCTWTNNGNLFLFGGLSADGYMNDLYTTTPGSNLSWTKVSGNALPNDAGSYGTLGTANASNLPPARFQASAWSNQGKLYFLAGYKGSSTAGNFNDVWSFSNNNWTWIQGPNTQNDAGNTTQFAARRHSHIWLGNDGKIYLYAGRDGLKDLWVGILQ